MVQFQTKEYATKTHSLKWQDTIDGKIISTSWIYREISFGWYYHESQAIAN
jgi:hypothetical protein